MKWGKELSDFYPKLDLTFWAPNHYANFIKIESKLRP